MEFPQTAADAVQWLVEDPVPLYETKGHLSYDHRVMLQDEWWIDRKRVPHRISEMSREHVLNVYNMIVRDPTFCNDSRIIGIKAEFFQSVESPGADFDFDTSKLASALSEDPLVWALKTPLMRRLAEICRANGSMPAAD